MSMKKIVSLFLCVAMIFAASALAGERHHSRHL